MPLNETKITKADLISQGLFIIQPKYSIKVYQKVAKPLKTTILTILALVLTASVFAQSPQLTAKNAPEATKAPAIAPLALTDTEKLDLAKLATIANEADRVLAARLRVVLELSCEACDEAYAVNLAVVEARKFYRETLKPAQANYLNRLEAIQQAHDCLGCELREGAFVRPAKAVAK